MRAALVVFGLAAAALFLWRVRSGNGSEVDGPSADEEAPPCDVLTNPSWRRRLPALRKVSLKGCGLTAVPREIGRLASLVHLDLGGNDLVTLPDELALCANLDVLFVLGARRMTRIPRVLGSMPSITRLGLRSNGIEVVEGDALPPNVVHLILTDNAISLVDDRAYDRLKNVKKLMLANNRLEAFGAGGNAAKLVSLELLRLANNRLRRVEPALLELPRLAWLAMAGNPCLDGGLAARAALAIPEISLDDVDFGVLGGEALGAGASGVVRAAAWRGAPVAVKTLLPTSSDGRAVDELAVYRNLAATAWPESLIRALAVAPPADGRDAAVIMERLPRSVRDLAKPPTIAEVTADRYGETERFSVAFALRTLRGVAAGCAALHAARVSHGDVYGHNVLVDDARGLVKLGDFGAAFVYRGALEAGAENLFEKIEVRAFGVLAAELAARLAQASGATRTALAALADACLQGHVRRRPTFSEVVTTLDTLRLVK